MKPQKKAIFIFNLNEYLADSQSFIKLHTSFSLEINLNVTSDFRRSQKNFFQLG
jgi:hypothetical protein